MALQTLRRPFVWPEIVKSAASGGYALSNTSTLSSAGDYHCTIFCAKEDMVISHVGFYHASATGSPTADVRIETVDASGLPSGTLWAANTNIVTGTLVGGWLLSALTASASISRGQWFAVKIAINSGTSFALRQISGVQLGSAGLPYDVTKTGGGAVTRVRRNGAIVWALGSSATAFYSVADTYPASSITSATTFNNTNSAKRGLRFQVPFLGRCCGARFPRSTSVGDYNLILANDAGTAIETQAVDGDANAQSTAHFCEVFFDTPRELTINTWYRLVLEPSSATNIDVTYITLPSVDYASAYPGGANAHYTTFATATWTDSTDTIPFFDVLFDQLSDGAGAGGGLLANPGLRGGMI